MAWHDEEKEERSKTKIEIIIILSIIGLVKLWPNVFIWTQENMETTGKTILIITMIITTIIINVIRK